MTDDEKSYSDLLARIETLEKKIALLTSSQKKLVIILTSSFMDKALVALTVANLAAVAGYEVNIFCTLWGVNLLRNTTTLKDNTLLEKAAKMMMKKGPDQAILSQMHMLGLGTKFMKALMKEHKSSSLKDLMETAIEMGVQFHACEMMIAMMGIKKEELIEHVKTMGGMDYVHCMSSASVNFIV